MNAHAERFIRSIKSECLDQMIFVHAKSEFHGIRSRWSPQQIAERVKLVAQLDWLVADGIPLTQKALGYILSYDEISCAIPGLRSKSTCKAP